MPKAFMPQALLKIIRGPELLLQGLWVQMAPDGFHPGPGIYAQWGHRAAARIRNHLEANTTETPMSWRRGTPPN
jgi:hypothetical protein